MFSPYYAWARRGGRLTRAHPENHCAVNVALYRRAAGQARFQHLWAMTERGAGDLHRDRQRLQIGPSALTWTDQGLLLTVDERCAPWPQRLRGRVLLQPQCLPARQFALDEGGHHHWQPIGPVARVHVDFDEPALQWQGSGYLDGNHGSRPLADDLLAWDWSRSIGPDGDTRLHYELVERSGHTRALALQLTPSGEWRDMPAGLLQALPNSAWGLARRSRIDPVCQHLASLEDGPFYARSLLTCNDPGSCQHGVHERVDLHRFTRPWVQAMLPFKMPRRARR